MEENYELAKWLNDEMSEAELKAFQSRSDYHLYEKIKNYSSELRTSHFDEETMLNTILASKKESPKVVPLRQNWIFRVAAILVLGFGMLMAYQNFATSTEWAENGKKTSFLLPDDSEVVLNSGSSVEFKKWNWDNNRNVNLDGEAYFKVAKGKKFKVVTDLGTVSVLGTQFNVKERNDRFDVTCFEGRVKVNYNQIELIITKGETVSFENGKQILHDTITNPKPLWTDSQIAFEREHLNNIIEEIERQYGIAIDFKNSNTNQLFTGKLPTNNLDVALQIIASTYHLKVNKTDSNQYTMVEDK